MLTSRRASAGRRMSDRVDPRVSTDLAPEAPGSGPRSTVKKSGRPDQPMRQNRMVLERLAATGEIPGIRRVQAACKRRLSGTPAPGEPTGRCRVRALGGSRGKTEPSTGYFAAPRPCGRRREGRFRKIRPTKGVSARISS